MTENNLKYMEYERRRCLNEILNSKAPYKIIVAGPGTGKTHTFKELLEVDPGKSLVITLINNLVSQMSEEIGNLGDVRTFHSFSKALLYKHPFGGITNSFYFYPNIDQIISIDSVILKSSGLIHNQYSVDDFGIAFRVLDEDNECIKFFFKLSNYYNAVGFDDSVYRVFLAFKEFDELIPNYHNIMVDEYQDFNFLEVEFLNKLETKNKILIVGDDDQSIYQFRQASPIYLRDKVKDLKYSRFSLPFCTRCTAVVISLVKNIVIKATSLGLLNERIEKDFRCYLPEKQLDNESFPKIQKVICSVHRKNAPYISRYIKNIISGIPVEECILAKQKKYPLVLIVGKSHYLNSIYPYLRDNFSDVKLLINLSEEESILVGYSILLKDKNSNLGWRLIIEHFIPEKLDDFVEKAYRTGKDLFDLLNQEFIVEHIRILEILTKIKNDPSCLIEDECNLVKNKLQTSIEDIYQFFNPSDENSEIKLDEDSDKDNAFAPSILLTNFSGCKGLSSGYTFITGFEEGVFPKAMKPTETEVNKFIVAVTRTRKQCHIIHTNHILGEWTKPSMFWRWVPNEISEKINVNRNYINNTK